MLKLILIISIVITLIFVAILYFDVDRSIVLSICSFESLIKSYALKPRPAKRTVIILRCDSGLCESTLKSILDQSIAVNDIAVETDHPELIDNAYKSIVTIHRPNTAPMREVDANTLVLILNNGSVYPYDFVESKLRI